MERVMRGNMQVALGGGENLEITSKDYLFLLESATKAGEITIDIPRLQLTGAMDLSMTATGACQTPLEGNALASGCSGCDGKAVYATITQFITGKEWFDNFEGLIMEDAPIGTALADVKVYAYGGSMAAKELVHVAEGSTEKFGVIITGSDPIAAGEYTFKTVAKKDGSPALEGKKTIV